MTDNELKPCPFCGGIAELRSFGVNTLKEYWVSCYEHTCKINPQTGCYKTAEEAIAAWNRRAE